MSEQDATKTEGKSALEELLGTRGIREMRWPRKKAYVYFLLDDDEVVYVGQTTCLEYRIWQHEVDKVFNRVLFLQVSHQSLRLTERQFIQSLKPKYNRTLTGSKVVTPRGRTRAPKVTGFPRPPRMGKWTPTQPFDSPKTSI